MQLILGQRNKVQKLRLLLLIALISFAALLRFFLLSNQSLWVDESLSLDRTDATSLGGVIENLNATPYDKYQPIYFILLFFWQQLFGDSVTALRSLSALFGTLSVALAALTAFKIYGERHAIWTLTILSTSAFHVYYSQEVRAYALVLFFAALELYLFCDVLVDQKSITLRSKLFFWLAVAAGCLSSVFIFIFTASICVAHLFAQKNFKQWLGWWLPILLCILPAILLYSTSETFSSLDIRLVNWYGTHILQNFLFVAYGLLAGTTYLAPPELLRGDDKVHVLLGYWPHLLLLVVVVATILLALTTRLLKKENTPTANSRRRANYFFAALITISLIFSTFFVIATHINWVPRHSASIIIAIAVLIPSSFCNLDSSRESSLIAKAALISTFLLLVVNLLSLRNYFFDYRYSRDDYRTAAEYVTNDFNVDIPSVLLWGEQRLLQYYGDNKTIKVDGTQIEADELPEFLKEVTDGAEEVLLVINREFFLAYSVESALRGAYTLEAKESFSYFDIYRFKQL